MDEKLKDLMSEDNLLRCKECGTVNLRLIKMYSTDDRVERVVVCPLGHQTTFVNGPDDVAIVEDTVH